MATIDQLPRTQQQFFQDTGDISRLAQVLSDSLTQTYQDCNALRGVRDQKISDLATHQADLPVLLRKVAQSPLLSPVPAWLSELYLSKDIPWKAVEHAVQDSLERQEDWETSFLIWHCVLESIQAKADAWAS